MHQILRLNRKPLDGIKGEYSMPTMEWQEAFEIISSYIVKISSPDVLGTGFLVAYSKNKQLCGIATAAHVVNQANHWGQPIRIQHHRSKDSILLNDEKRAILMDESLDTAIIIAPSKYFNFPEQ